MSAQEREALTPVEAEAVLLDAYVEQGLRESGEKTPTKRLLLAAHLMGEAESLLESVVAARAADLLPVAQPGADTIERLQERVEWEIKDYCQIFRTPYSLSPRLQLCADLLAALVSPVRQPEEGALRIEEHWLVREVNEHTCGTGPNGYYGAHEPGCGLVPELDLSALPGWRSEAEIKAEALREAADQIRLYIEAGPDSVRTYPDWRGRVSDWLRARAAQVTDTEGSE